MSEQAEVWFDSGGWTPPEDPNAETRRCYTDAELAAHVAARVAEALAPIEARLARYESQLRFGE
jgi:hypothetical protein